VGRPPGANESLVDGLFLIAQNPVYAAMIPSFAGIALLAANAVTSVGIVALVVALELQTRLAEGPS
jgi:protein-S-isoprenylcysteine O-methyltransferase Ste14